MSALEGLNAIAWVANRKIEEALAEGRFDNLPGAGKPLHLEDLSHLPPDMRMAYTILRNSGHLEEALKPGQAATMREMLARVPDEGQAYAKMQRLKIMLARVGKARAELFPERRREEAPDFEDSPYLDKILREK